MIATATGDGQNHARGLKKSTQQVMNVLQMQLYIYIYIYITCPS